APTAAPVIAPTVAPTCVFDNPPVSVQLDAISDATSTPATVPFDLMDFSLSCELRNEPSHRSRFASSGESGLRGVVSVLFDARKQGGHVKHHTLPGVNGERASKNAV